MSIKRLKNGNFEIDEETLRELIMSKTIVDTYEDEGYGLKELDDELEEYVDNLIMEIE